MLKQLVGNLQEKPRYIWSWSPWIQPGCWFLDWLSWVVASRAAGADWLESTNTCLRRFLSLSLIPWFSLCFLSYPAHSCLHPVDSWVNPPHEVKDSSSTDRKKNHPHPGRHAAMSNPLGKNSKFVNLCWLTQRPLTLYSIWYLVSLLFGKN